MKTKIINLIKENKIKFTLLSLIIIVLSLFWGVYGLQVFFTNFQFKFQSPIEFHKPIWLERKQVVVQKHNELAEIIIPVAEAKELEVTEQPAVAAELPKSKITNAVIAEQKYATLIWGIYGLESSFGKQDKCVRKGKGINGLGWGQSLTVDNCYKDFATVVKKVNNRLDDMFNKEGMNIPQALCTYNLGKPNGKVLNDCEYYQNYLKLMK